jgi:hypothetical protein|tara:strand:- start:189 stop:485 length:297 start_codon:yes stop_codon:yes gene_type:complete
MNDDFQLVIFSHLNNKGVQTAALPAIQTNHNKLNKRVYFVNPLVDDIDDLDIYKENILNINQITQQIENNKDRLVCLFGDLFRDNSLIKGIKVFNFKL